MFDLDSFLITLFAISVITSLVVQAIKQILDEKGINYSANALASIVSIVLSIFSMIAYVVLENVAFTNSLVIYVIVIIVGSWLCSMLGYDKVKQTLLQIKNNEE